MSASDLELQLRELRELLENGSPLSAEDRASLHALALEIEQRLAPEQPAEPLDSDNLVDGLNLAVERFEVSHPNMTMTLRNIMQSLASMGI